jgi:urocanate hydratase
VDADEKAYSSTDGVAWQVQVSNSNVQSILGVLPGKEAAKDSLLVVTKRLGKDVFAKTSDMQSLQIVENISYSKESNEVPAGFPVQGFTSVTNYDRSNLNRNILAVTAALSSSNLTWSLRQGDGQLEVESNNQRNIPFDPSEGVRAFLYDGYIYALTKNLFYKTSGFGFKWVAASTKEKFIPGMSSSKQSIIVDSDNYIWIFGGIDTSTEASGFPVRQVWKGRINRLAR